MAVTPFCSAGTAADSTAVAAADTGSHRCACGAAGVAFVGTGALAIFAQNIPAGREALIDASGDDRP
jgi:hypothetical protein